jgi:hypothetical protein
MKAKRHKGGNLLAMESKGYKAGNLLALEAKGYKGGNLLNYGMYKVRPISSET